MFPSCVTCIRATPGVYRFYYNGRRVEAEIIGNGALYVSHSFTENGRVVAFDGNSSTVSCRGRLTVDSLAGGAARRGAARTARVAQQA
jgi:hypothetical protein